MTENENPKDFPPQKPAPPVGRDGADPSTSIGGPSGSWDAKSASQRFSCIRCGEEKEQHPLSKGWCVDCRYEALDEAPPPRPFALDDLAPLVGGRPLYGVCFKCSAPNSPRRANRDSGYICFDCATQPRKRGGGSGDVFRCGCAWNDERFVMLNPFVSHGDTVVARPPSQSCVACQGSGNIKDTQTHLHIRRNVGHQAEGIAAPRSRSYYSPADDAEEFLAAGSGLHIESAGSTGQPPGRPTKGLREADLIWGELSLTFLRHPEISKLLREILERPRRVKAKDLLVPLSVALALTPTLNVAAFAKASGYSLERVYQMIKRGREKVSQNPPKGGREKTRLDRIEIRDGKQFNVFVLPRGMKIYVPPSDTDNSPKGDSNGMNTQATMVERVSALEVGFAELRETVARELGLPETDQQVTDAIESFLASVQSGEQL